MPVLLLSAIIITNQFKENLFLICADVDRRLEKTKNLLVSALERHNKVMNTFTLTLVTVALLLVAVLGVRAAARWRVKAQTIKRRQRVELEATHKILKYVCDYDPLSCSTLNEFQTIVQNTHCLFAKKAKLWAARPWDDQLNLEENIQRSIPTFIKWVTVGKYLTTLRIRI